MATPIKSYKGFNKNLACRDFQYEVGKEYKLPSNQTPELCERGFHACENPFDVTDFYGDVLNHRFCEVEQSGQIVSDGKKTASSKIKIKAEIGFTGLFKAGIELLKEITDPSKIIQESDNSDTNDNGKHYAQIGSSGYSAKIGSSGDYAQIGSSGYYAQIGSSGYYAKIGSSGYSAKIGSSGDSAKIGSSGDYAKIGSSGDYAKIGSSGDYAQIGSSGDYAQIGSSGYYAQIGSSGYSAKIGSSGYSAKIGSSGYSAKIDSTGEDSVICCAGHGSIVKAKKGSWVTLAEWIYSDEKQRYIPKCVKTEHVDGERIKADTWYKLVDGEFSEVK